MTNNSKGKCGMNFKQFKVVADDYEYGMSMNLTDTQLRNLFEGKKILVKDLKSKAGKTYDAYFVPLCIEEFSYTKDGKEITGLQYKVRKEFAKNKK